MDFNEVKNLIKKHNIRFVDLKFTDLLGTWQHFTVPVSEVDETFATLGSGFDGSSIRGFQSIHESDMNLVPDFSTTIIDPFSSNTLSIVGDVSDPKSKGPYSRDPRYIAKKAEEHLKKSGLADVSYFGPEAEFFIFDTARFAQNEYSGFYYINSDEGIWNSGAEGNNLAHRPRHKEGYYPVSPVDAQQEIRNEMVTTMEACGMKIEKHHHEVATAGQAEIDIRYAPLTHQADNMMLYKYIVKNVAKKHNKTATFMPKPLFNDNGSGMHTHQSLWKDGQPLFAGSEYAGFSKMGLYYIGGILKHAAAITAFANPTMNSYKRLVPGFEAPVNLVYSMRNRSAAIRIPMYSDNPKAKRLEYRSPDPSCNPYLAFAAMLMAGLDGIKNKIDPGLPMDHNLYELPPEEAKKIKSLPGSLAEALHALDTDRKFLTEGGVFTDDLIDTWIEWKKEKDIDPVRIRPHPWEFHLYYDC